MPDDEKTFDISAPLSQERFRRDVTKYVIGREITRIVVRPTQVEIYLDSGDSIKLAVHGQDIAISVPTDQPVPAWDSGPRGRVN